MRRWSGRACLVAVVVLLAACESGNTAPPSTTTRATTANPAPTIAATTPATSTVAAPTWVETTANSATTVAGPARTLQDVCDEMERDAGALAQSLFDGALTGPERADVYDQLVPIYRSGLDSMFDVVPPSPSLDDDLDEFRLSIGQIIKQMTESTADLRQGVELLSFFHEDRDRIVERNQSYAELFGVGRCGLGPLPVDVPAGSVSADDAAALRAACAEFQSRLAAALPQADDDRQFGNDLLGAILGMLDGVYAVRHDDLQRTVETALRAFEDESIADSRGRTNSEQFAQYQDEMGAVRSLFERYVGSSCGLDFTPADFTPARTSS
ncbi:MAG: hypothetical protein JWM12_3153 [Ilumatobacteraceae bacterium]|nr:hypothetical protein [Ilumatobacteraceae bacterium]